MTRKLFVLFSFLILTGLSYLLSIWLESVATENIFKSVTVLTVLYGIFSIGKVRNRFEINVTDVAVYKTAFWS